MLHVFTVFHHAPSDQRCIENGIYFKCIRNIFMVILGTCWGVTPRWSLLRILNMQIVLRCDAYTVLYFLFDSIVSLWTIISPHLRRSGILRTYKYLSMLACKNHYGFWCSICIHKLDRFLVISATPTPGTIESRRTAWKWTKQLLYYNAYMLLNTVSKYLTWINRSVFISAKKTYDF